jgi:dihydroxyacetone kinase
MNSKKEFDAKDIANMFLAGSDAIMEKGKAKPGDKTMLDALVPAVQAFLSAIDAKQSIDSALQSAKEAAANGAEATKNMIAQAGRARWQGERTVGYLDPGAVLVKCFFEELFEIVRARYHQ